CPRSGPECSARIEPETPIEAVMRRSGEIEIELLHINHRRQLCSTIRHCQEISENSIRMPAVKCSHHTQGTAATSHSAVEIRTPDNGLPAFDSCAPAKLRPLQSGKKT